MDRRSVVRAFGWVAGGVALGTLPGRYSLSLPGDYLRDALRRLGYLGEDGTGAATSRALARFQRHAQRRYRVSALTGVPADVRPHECFDGACEGQVDEATVFELNEWLSRGWRLPAGRFKFESLAGGDPKAPRGLRWSTLREDAARRWRELLREATACGATLDPPYGDTLRPLGYHNKDGASPRSFHITGRAIDLNQYLAEGRKQRYYLVKEPRDGRMYFRIWCRAARQDGSQGRRFEAGALQCYRAFQDDYPIPEGWYIDLTALLEAARFVRIRARLGWEQNSLRAEWWHYHYAVDTQPTFLDECELVGIGEADLLRAGYSVPEMDRRPG